MLRICDLGKHLFEDGVKISSVEEVSPLLKSREQVSCNDCWEKFTKQSTYVLEKWKRETE